jgi:hypothetical protein
MAWKMAKSFDLFEEMSDRARKTGEHVFPADGVTPG